MIIVTTSGSRHYRPAPISAYGIIHLGPIFATRKVVAPFSNIQSCWADQYGSIDTRNIKICPLVIILWQNILGHQQVALNSLLTTIPNRNYRTNRSGLILQKKIRKFAQNTQTDREFNYRGHSYPLWIVGMSGPIAQNF